MTGFYYRYNGDDSRPLYFGRTAVTARMRFHGRDCIETQTQTWNFGDVDPPDTWHTTSYVALDEAGSSTVRTIHRNSHGESGTIWDVNGEMDPWDLTVGLSGDPWTTIEESDNSQTTRERPPDEDGSTWTWHRPWKITGVSDVSIGARTWRCLRKEIRHISRAGYRWMCEEYIAENGRTILTRGYEAETGDQYAYVEGQPEIVVDGLTHRLLCDMIPAHALDEETTRSLAAALTRFGRC